ncbi:hypothetical protein ASD54_08690 [Rhizobium sp. Root149]|uniref:hypothetical protein n=1 Tax=Rhizobium sp. Root149 TaxID=1736473 RepID=UPI000714E417|nr:hypothetical protein [Rhizobium sp. Root149]KQZ50322.1 hypothetical protein ASD54_08690 [Rhizobium sp. Root149]
MQAPKPITIHDILVAADPAARHGILVGRKQHYVRGLSVREILHLIALYPTLAEVIDPSTPRTTADEWVEAIGVDAIETVGAKGSDVSAKLISGLEIEFKLDLFFSVLSATLMTRPGSDFFPKEKKPAQPKRPRRPTPKDNEKAADDVRPDSGLLAMVKDATEYTLRTGRDGMELTPAALGFALRVQADINRNDRISIFHAVAAAMGDKDSHEAVGDI